MVDTEADRVSAIDAENYLFLERTKERPDALQDMFGEVGLTVKIRRKSSTLPLVRNVPPPAVASISLSVSESV
jgi:hypothetical protein